MNAKVTEALGVAAALLLLFGTMLDARVLMVAAGAFALALVMVYRGARDKRTQ